MRIIGTIFGTVFAALAAYAAIRGIFLMIPALSGSAGALADETRLFQTGALYQGITLEGAAILLAGLAYVCFRSRRSSFPKPPESDADAQ